LVFYERHWDTVTRYMATNLSADVAVIVDRYASDQSPDQFKDTSAFARRYFQFDVQWDQGGILTKEQPNDRSEYAYQMLDQGLQSRLSYPYSINLHLNEDWLSVGVQFPNGVMQINAGRKRIFSSTSILVILWTVSTSVLLFGIALVFLRGQVRPIVRLARAARQLGLGRPAADYQLAGAKEVRLAGRAFQAMRQRIQRQMVERTEMLAGVSHDLRTPLTRMKLQLEFLPDGAEKNGIREDILDMEAMIEGYINFASNAVTEDMVDINIKDIITASISSFGLPADQLTFTNPDLDVKTIPLRKRGIRRAMDNLIGNAVRYGQHCEVSVTNDEHQIQIIIDDDGPGIPKDQRIAVLRPFVQLDPDKTKIDSSHGTGLGLSIANDAALSHGGNLLLGDSPMGGLRVRLQLPV
jgi:two-component system osmolarity sensor histidine kinase EnvZ